MGRPTRGGVCSSYAPKAHQWLDIKIMARPKIATQFAAANFGLPRGANPAAASDPTRCCVLRDQSPIIACQASPAHTTTAARINAASTRQRSRRRFGKSSVRVGTGSSGSNILARPLVRRAYRRSGAPACPSLVLRPRFGRRQRRAADALIAVLAAPWPAAAARRIGGEQSRDCRHPIIVAPVRRAGARGNLSALPIVTGFGRRGWCRRRRRRGRGFREPRVESPQFPGLR